MISSTIFKRFEVLTLKELRRREENLMASNTVSSECKMSSDLFVDVDELEFAQKEAIVFSTLTLGHESNDSLQRGDAVKRVVDLENAIDGTVSGLREAERRVRILE
jgi:hypothetical protein